jgi:hypothetical protein
MLLGVEGINSKISGTEIIIFLIKVENVKLVSKILHNN